MTLSNKYRNLKLVIFDVDGTLYRQAPLRRIMALKLAFHYLLRPWKYKELLMLKEFREQREILANQADADLSTSQYRIPAQSAGVSVAVLEALVKHWMLIAPLPYLKKNVFPSVHKVFHILKENKIKIAVLSDYPASEKLEVLGLKADLIVSAAEAHINCLKPGTKGISYILNYFNIKPAECLFVGDRPELDGKCAGRMKIPFYQIRNNDDHEKLIVLLKKQSEVF
ncbi:MAG: HAD family hydrolase [Bacteroidia bacterium]